MPVVALFSLGATCFAAIAAIFLLAGEAGRGVTVGWVSRAPLIGRVLAAVVSGLYDGAIAGLRSWLDSGLYPLGRVAWGIRVSFDSLHAVISYTLGDLANMAWRIATHTVPVAFAAAERYAWEQGQWAASVGTRAENWAKFETSRIWSYAIAGVGAAVADAGHALGWAEAETSRIWAYVLGPLEAWVTGEVGRVSAYAYSVYTWADHQIAATAAATLARAVDTTLTDVDNAAGAAEQLVWPGVADGVRALEGVIGADFPGIADALGAIPRVTPADLARAIEAAGLVAIPMLRFMRDCGVPSCRDLGPARELFHGLQSAAFGAAMAAWVAYCVTDPVGAADDTAAVGVPLATATAGTALGLFGVAA